VKVTSHQSLVGAKKLGNRVRASRTQKEGPIEKRHFGAHGLSGQEPRCLSERAECPEHGDIAGAAGTRRAARRASPRDDLA